jgi:cytochrome c biogenesis protein
MRTAVMLLAIIAALSVIATMLPQRPLQPQRVSAYLQSHPQLGPIFDRLGLFAVYESWWLIAAALLMYISLGHCVLVRGRALFMRWRKGLPRNAQFIGEGGSLLFHLSFFVLLFGVLWGKANGFTAFVNVLEGQSVVEARPSYDQIEEGYLFSPPQHKGFEVRVDSFNASYYGDGRPKDFVTHAEVFDQGQRVTEKDIRVNQYLNYEGVKFYQASYGWAPVIRVTDALGHRVFDGPVLFFGDPAFANGVVKIPASGSPGQQLGARAFFLPDVKVVAGGATAGSADLKNPLLDLAFFKGDLHADQPQNVYDLDVSQMKQVDTVLLPLGQSRTIPGGFTVTFPNLMRYTGLQVTDDPGVPIIWAAFGLLLTGLLVRLYLASWLHWREERSAPVPHALVVA